MGLVHLYIFMSTYFSMNTYLYACEFIYQSICVCVYVYVYVYVYVCVCVCVCIQIYLDIS